MGQKYGFKQGDIVLEKGLEKGDIKLGKGENVNITKSMITAEP